MLAASGNLLSNGRARIIAFSSSFLTTFYITSSLDLSSTIWHVRWVSTAGKQQLADFARLLIQIRLNVSIAIKWNHIQLAKFGTNASGILFSWRDNLSYRLYTLGPS